MCDSLDFPVWKKRLETVPPCIRNGDTKPFAFTIVGRRNVGKSYFIRWIYKTVQKKFDIVIVMSQTAGSLQYRYMDRPIVINEFSPETLAKLWELQEEKKKKYKYYPALLLILDDVTDSKLTFSKDLDKFYTQGRHRNVSVILSVQNPTFISSTIRQNSTKAFCFMVNGKARDRIKEEWLADKLNSSAECDKAIVDAFSAPHQCLSISDFEEGYKIYKAPAKF